MDQLYRQSEAALPPIELSYRDYVFADEALRRTALYARSLAYWQERVKSLPPAPELPLAVDPSKLEKTVFKRRSLRMPAERWSKLTERAMAEGLNATALLLTAMPRCSRRGASLRGSR